MIQALKTKLHNFNFFLFAKKYIKFGLKKILPNIFYDRLIISFDKIAIKLKFYSHKKLLVVFPNTVWHVRKQRPQHIVSRFAKKGYKVIFINLDFNENSKEYLNENDCRDYVDFFNISENLHGLNISSYSDLNAHMDEISGANKKNLLLSLSYVLGAIRPQDPIFLVQMPAWGEIAIKLRDKFGGKIVYDYMDDHSGFSTAEKEIAAKNEVLLKNSNLIIATSKKLKEEAEISNTNVSLIRNGTEFEHFYNSKRNGQLDNLEGPIIGYYGAINDWFDSEIIKYCALQQPDWNFVLIGGTDHDSFEFIKNDIKKLPNVHFLGEKPYDELPGYLAYFDVCIIPFKLIPLILATNPVKFYEYLSAGKPVVSVKLPELEQYSDCCYLAENKEEFLGMLKKAFVEKNNQDLRGKRLELAKKNSWDERFENFEMAINNLQ